MKRASPGLHRGCVRIALVCGSLLLRQSYRLGIGQDIAVEVVTQMTLDAARVGYVSGGLPLRINTISDLINTAVRKASVLRLSRSYRIGS